MKTEKKTDVLYIRVKPSVKKWITKKMKKEGWNNMSGYLSEFFENLKANDRKRR